ncbi:MAG: SH3 domain-containing protein [Eubacteriales bacterium]|nr:SH3 domain-containing protein [Eubacteriales bacterium]MDD3883143.1 SH3 domain-containing protein [Eubacteriales bacterium]MDD4512687.1 SH3 domain-containing protein [Eubacteriales bacterium]
MKKIISVLICALLICACIPFSAVAMPADVQSKTMYVFTSNGGYLNLRETDSTNGNVVTQIPFGSEVAVVDYEGKSKWQYIKYNGYEGYVMTRYLSTYRHKRPTVTPAPAATVKPQTDIYANFVKTNYYVTIRPSSPSGFVNLRWAPTKSVPCEGIYYAGKLLLVLQDNGTWCQVFDEETLTSGYVMKAFLTYYSEYVPIGEGATANNGIGTGATVNN